MEKAYDPKDLAKRLRDKGLDVAEEAVRDIAVATFDWLHESAQVSENKLDDVVDAAALPKLREFVLAQIDKIDGKADAPSA